MLVAEGAQPAHELRVGGDEPALALLRLEHDRGHRLRRDVLSQHPLELRERLGGARAAVGVRERRPVDLGGERAHAGLVRMGLRGHGHRQQRPAVEAALERDHRRPARVQASELDGVLDGLGAGVEERGARVTGDRHERREPLRQLDEAAVRDDREVGVEEPGNLFLDRLDDPRVAVTDVDHADPAREVDEDVPVHVRDRRPLRTSREHRQVDEQRMRHRVPLTLEQLT